MKKILSLFALTTLLFSAFVSSQTKEADDSSQIIDSARKKELLDSAEMLDSLAYEYSKKGDFEKAIELKSKQLKFLELVSGKDNREYAEALNIYALFHYYYGEYAKAKTMGIEALNIQERVLGEQHIDYLVSLNNLALYYLATGDYNISVEIGKKVLVRMESYFGKNSIQYAISLNNLASSYYSKGDYSAAIDLWQDAISTFERIDSYGNQYASSINNISLCYREIGNFFAAIKLEQKALSIVEKTKGKRHPDYAKLLNSLSLLYSDLGDYRESISIGNTALKVLEETVGKENPDYAATLNNIASSYRKLGDNSMAIELSDLSLQIKRKKLGINHPDCASSLNNLASSYINLGVYSKAIEYTKESLRISQNNSKIVTPLMGLSLCLLEIGSYTEAFDIAKEALLYCEHYYGKDNPKYAKVLNILASCYERVSNYEEAIKHETKALTINERCFGKWHHAYAESLNNLAWLHSKQGNHSKAIEFETNSLAILEKTIGKDNLDFAIASRNMTNYAYQIRNKSLLSYWSHECFKSSKKIIRNSFCSLTDRERLLFWSEHQSFFLNEVHEYLYYYPINPLISIGYNSILLGKGLLLNNSQTFSILVLNSGDNELITLLYNIRSNQITLNEQYKKCFEDRTIDTDSLENLVQSMERELLRKSKAYGDFTKNMDIEWTDVQAKLKKNDAAVEFVSFNTDNDSTIYAAYVLKKGMKSPAFVRLFEEKQLKNDISIYSNHEAAKLIWEPMAEYLADVKNIYFAPSGQLYNIAIESIPHWSDSLLMSEKWNLYRLSSTRELAISKDKHKTETAMLYGGIKYDTDTATLIENGKKYTQHRDFSPSISMDSLNIRGGFDYLEETKTEIENINNSLKILKINADLFTDTVATEASFKALAGKGKNLLHLATHGFYWAEEEAEVYKGASFLMSDDAAQYRDVEDKALTRSGVVFAGANTSLKGQKLPNGIDDGVLTAAELMLLDLHDVDFVALSSCQSGLGEIKGDGVFGLQRGFKIAGVKSLLMSLWKVDDKATQLLMTEFYKNLATGKSKRESLLNAQKFLREYEKEGEKYDGPQHNAAQKQQAQEDAQNKTTKIIRPYESPRYWAAFILLDALD